MTPDVHQVQVLLLEQADELLTQLQQTGIVVTGRLPAVGILRQPEVPRGAHHAAVADAAHGQQRLDVLGDRAVGIAQAADGITGVLFQRAAVRQDFLHHIGQRAPGDGRVGHRMTGHLMPLVQLGNLLRLDMLRVHQTAVEVEGAANAVFVEDLHQTAVLGSAVVIGHGERLVLAAGETLINLVHERSSPATDFMDIFFLTNTFPCYATLSNVPFLSFFICISSKLSKIVPSAIGNPSPDAIQ